ENKRYYRYLKEGNNFIGKVSYHYDNKLDIYTMGIVVYAKYRNQGYGKAGLDLLCKAAKENGIKYLYDDIAIDNKAIKLFLDNGFIEEYRTSELIYLKKDLSKAELKIDKYKVAPVKRSKVRYKNNNLSGEDIDLLRDNRRKKEKVSICDTHEDGA
ncbi:MAG: GNAT family N-acetyltransferase, partial [Bacilli bacterium]|nr:GNAT family N-acetyltransferase [Bacilli bacterium]